MEKMKFDIRSLDDIDLKYHIIRRKIQRLGIKIYRLLSVSSHEEKVSYESEAISVTRRIIKMPDTELFMTPKTSKRIIRNNKLGMSVILKNHTIHIYENKVPYPTQMSDKGYEHIINFFDDEIEKRREIMETEIEKDVKNILKSIFKKVVDNEKF